MKTYLQHTAIRLIALIILGLGFSGLSYQAMAQNGVAALDFEVDGNGADWDWVTFENADNPALEFIDNPDKSGINTSDRVARFTAREGGAPWAGSRGTGGEPFLFDMDSSNRTITIMVWKTVISDVGIKLETASNWSQGEIRVANTRVNEWEAITIDFSNFVNPPEGEKFNGISIFPDFNLDGRGQENVIFFDNIEFEGFIVGDGNGNGGEPGEGKEVVALDFEVDGNGADWSWATFENADNPALEFIDNPDKSGINTSDRVARFTAREGGAPWAGTRGTGGEPFLFDMDSSNRTITIMVWKTVISDVGIKLETASNWSQGEIRVANTKVNEWEAITIDFSNFVNPPEGEMFNGISVFPDFNLDGRGQENVIFFDNIEFEGFVAFDDNGNGGEPGEGKEVVALDFEVDGNGADWSWATFENADNPALEFIDNPDKSGINTSDRVARFTARADGAPWAGTRGTGGLPFLFDEGSNTNTITIMVWKTVISDVGIKLETASNWSQGELRVANTRVNEWEAITIDFSNFVNPPEGEMFNGISVFPDFNLDGRGQENVIFFDNIEFEGFLAFDDNGNGGTGETPSVAAPTPTQDAANVISVFSNAFTDVDGTNFNPNWGQSTQVSFVEVDGSNVLRYANHNYQGTELVPAIDATGMTHIRIDMWTANAEGVSFTVISPGPQEKLFPLDITLGEWVSYDIPLEYFDNVNLADIFQMMFAGGNGQQTIYLGNIFFYDATATSLNEDDARPKEFELSQNYPNPFNPTTQIRFSLPVSDQVTIQVYNVVGQRVATLVDGVFDAGLHTVSFDGSNLSSGVYLYRLQSSNVVLTRKMMLVK